MKNISLIIIAIIIPLTSFPTLIKAPPGAASGGTFVGAGSGQASRFGPAPERNSNNNIRNDADAAKTAPTIVRNGEDLAKQRNKPKPGGGDPGAAVIVRPKPLPVELPKECTEAVEECVTTHIAGDDATVPKRGESCCRKLQNAEPCVCKFITSKNPKLKKAANGAFRGCGITRPVCIKMPMPKECRPEVHNCVNHHLYGTNGKPRYHGACCMKFKFSRSCMLKFLSSPDPKLNDAAHGIIQGCRLKNKTRT